MNIKTRLKNLELQNVSVEVEPNFIRMTLCGASDEDVIALDLNGIKYTRYHNEVYQDFQERVELLCDRTISQHVMLCIYGDKNE